MSNRAFFGGPEDARRDCGRTGFPDANTNTCSPYGGPAQFARGEDLTRDPTAVKAAIKRLTPAARADLIAWLLLYYRDDGQMFSPQITKRRERIALDGVEYWLAAVPGRS